MNFQTNFNSSMVRLKDVTNVYRLIRSGNFNSSMVRLKARMLGINPAEEKPFQFQYGSIKSKGTVFKKSCFSYFNSSMVRLKEGGGEAVTQVNAFQFQYGSIKSFIVNIYLL